jgi:hypothetical protein
MLMNSQYWFSAIAFSLAVASNATGQIVSGTMTVTGAEMH